MASPPAAWPHRDQRVGVAAPIPIRLCCPVGDIVAGRRIVMITRRSFNALAAGAALMPGMAAGRARAQAWSAQAWPTRPVRLIVPFAAGGPTDLIARVVGERLSKSWGQQVVIENRPGG